MLNDGAVFEGEAIGAEPPNGVTTGEVVFNTAMSGYQEIITDPSYAGQIITFTYTAHRQLRRHAVRQRGADAGVPRRDRARPRPSVLELARPRRSLDEFLEATRDCRASPASTRAA